MAGRSVLLIVGGGVAAFKALELARLLVKAEVRVRSVLTAAGARFVTPLSLQALTGDKVYTDLWSLTDESEMGHIELSRSADLLLVCPATADLMARAAHGLADDLASTTLLATDKRVLMAPAMNVRMWSHPATVRNLATLQRDGVRFVGPDEGPMACGEFGPGRMAEPAEIARAALTMLDEGGGTTAPGPLAGRRALVTAGPTLEPIDPVRFLSNRSSGKQGYAVAEALAELGAAVTLVSGPTALPVPPGVLRVDVETAEQMLAACRAALPVDLAVMVAAVADWRPDAAAPHKLKKQGDAPAALALVQTPDILATIAAPGPLRPRLVVGFAAETRELEGHAAAKLARKGCDLIVANDVGRPGVMGGDANAVSLVSRDGVERWEEASKREVARRLAARLARLLDGPSSP